MRNPQAFWAFVTALLSLGSLAAAFVAARVASDTVGLTEAMPAVPVALILALASVTLGRKARQLHDRSLGRAGNRVFIALARGLGLIALIVALTAALALAVFAVLTLALD
jgi:nitrogen fixation/metabolism regulation signal transduction histidine kinase